MVDVSNVSDLLLTLPGIIDIVRVFQVVGISIIVYLIFLIVKGLLQYKYFKRVDSIAKDVRDLNKKMDLFLNKKEKK